METVSGCVTYPLLLSKSPNLRGLKHQSSFTISRVVPGQEARSRLAGEFGLRDSPEVAVRWQAGSEALLPSLLPAGVSRTISIFCWGSIGTQHLFQLLTRQPIPGGCHLLQCNVLLHGS